MKKLFFILLLVASVAHGEIYKWTDKNGVVHFADSLEAVPAHFRNKTKIIVTDTTDNTTTVSPVAQKKYTPATGAVAPNVGDLKDKMMNDEKIMAIIRTMQNDKALQALLNNPAIMRAIQAGDTNTLQNNPDFLKILNDPRVKEIEKKLNDSETK